MTTVYIETNDFSSSSELKELLVRQRIAVQMVDANCEEIPTSKSGAALNNIWVCSQKFEQAQGGSKALLPRARGYSAGQVIIISENAQTFAVTSELGDRLLHVSLPAQPTGRPAVFSSAILALCDIIRNAAGAAVSMDEKTGQMIDLARRVAASDVTVFINGPTGSGKEVLAREVHKSSSRADKPFVAINCAAIPENMLEAILFGHSKGAFTGASSANKGIICAAEGGTLLLDEVSEMPVALQAKLLRVLQERTLTPLGSQTEIPVDIRVISTSNCDMRAEIAAGRFRADLFYRLNVFPLATQELADRTEDIPALATAMISRHVAKDLLRPVLSDDAIDMLVGYSWPGNVRELENVIQRALVLCNGAFIKTEDILLDSVFIPTMPSAEIISKSLAYAR